MINLSQYADAIKNSIDHAQFSDEKGVRIGHEAAIDKVISLIRGIKGHNKMMFVGNGGSSSIASHFAVDFTKVGGVRAVCFSDAGHLTCLSNDYSYEEVFQKSVEFYADPGDLLVAISSSGNSKNILNAVSAAKEKQCDVVTLSGFKPDNPLSGSGHINIYTPSSVYGTVESAHSIIIHCFLDHIVSTNS